MSKGDSIEQRGHTLEDAFFRRVDQQLIDKMKQDLSVEEGRKALAQACPWASDSMLCWAAPSLWLRAWMTASQPPKTTRFPPTRAEAPLSGSLVRSDQTLVPSFTRRQCAVPS